MVEQQTSSEVKQSGIIRWIIDQIVCAIVVSFPILGAYVLSWGAYFVIATAAPNSGEILGGVIWYAIAIIAVLVAVLGINRLLRQRGSVWAVVIAVAVSMAFAVWAASISVLNPLMITESFLFLAPLFAGLAYYVSVIWIKRREERRMKTTNA